MTLRTRGLARTPPALLALLVLCGCAASPAPPTVDAISDAEATALAEQSRVQERDRLLGLYPTAVIPDVAIERFIRADEYGVVISECMTEAGFPARTEADGGVFYAEVPAEQAQAQSVALFACNSAFPVHPRYSEPLNESQLRFLHAYYRDTLIPCIEAEGFSAPTLPSEQTFIDNLHTMRGYDPLERAAHAASFDEFQSLVSKCPSYPAELWGPVE